jgi:hypothetical protein
MNPPAPYEKGVEMETSEKNKRILCLLHFRF